MSAERLNPPDNSLKFESPLFLLPENLDEYGHLNNSQALNILDRERYKLFLGLIGVENLEEMKERYGLGIVVRAILRVDYFAEVKPEHNLKIMTKLWRPRPAEFMWHQTILANTSPAVVGTFQTFLIDPYTKKLQSRPPEGIFPI